MAPSTMPPLEDDDDEISSERDVSLLEPERDITRDDNFADEYKNVVLTETINGEEVVVLASIIGCKIPTRAIPLLETVYKKNRDIRAHKGNPKYPERKVLADVNDLLSRLEAMANEEDHHQYPNLERKLFYRIALFERDFWLFLKQAYEFRRLMDKVLNETITEEETKRFDHLSEVMAQENKTARPIPHKEPPVPITVLDDNATDELIKLEAALLGEGAMETAQCQEWQQETADIIQQVRAAFEAALKEDPGLLTRGTGRLVFEQIVDHPDAIYGFQGNNRYSVNDRAEIVVLSSQCRTTDIETVQEEAITRGFQVI